VLRRFLEGGIGLLARGPVLVLEKIKADLLPLLELSVVQTHQENRDWKALIVGTCWVICADVRVQERHD
jgi:hypothetical protein